MWHRRSIVFALALCGCGPVAVANDAAPSDAGTDAPVVRRDAYLDDAGQRAQMVNVFVVDGQGAVANATVVIDDANGDRLVSTTATSGMAMFPRVAWGTGRISFTIVEPAHVLTSYADYARADVVAMTTASGAITLTILDYYPVAALSGRFLGVASATDTLAVYPSVEGNLLPSGTTYAGSVHRDEAFDLFAWETGGGAASGIYDFQIDVVHAARVSHAAIHTAAVVDVDFGVPTPLATESGSFPLPPDGSRVQAAVPSVAILDDDTGARAVWGIVTRTALAASNVDVDFTTTRIADMGTVHPLSIYFVETTEGVYSRIVVDGLPATRGFASASEWLEPPAPASAGPQPLTDPITLSPVDPATDLTIELMMGSRALWFVYLPRGTTTFSVPAAPPGVDTSTWGAIDARIFACDPWPAHRTTCRRTAGGDVVQLMP